MCGPGDGITDLISSLTELVHNDDILLCGTEVSNVFTQIALQLAENGDTVPQWLTRCSSGNNNVFDVTEVLNTSLSNIVKRLGIELDVADKTKAKIEADAIMAISTKLLYQQTWY